jgi:hypothetical protein
MFCLVAPTCNEYQAEVCGRTFLYEKKNAVRYTVKCTHPYPEVKFVRQTQLSKRQKRTLWTIRNQHCQARSFT